MKEIGSIRPFEDEVFRKRITRWSIAVCIVGAVLLAIACVAYPPFSLQAPEGLIQSLLLILLVSVVAFCFHEVVHAIFFKLFAPAGSRVTFGANLKAAMLYACAEGIIYTRRQYFVIALAPTIVVTILLLPIGAACGWLLDFTIVAIIHLSGCVGDWAYIHEMVNNPAIAHVEDTDFGVRFYD